MRRLKHTNVNMRYSIYTFLILGLCLIFTSCSTTQYQVLFQQKNAIADSTYQGADSIKEYRIKSQDILQVRNLQDSKYILNNTPNLPVNSNVLGNNMTAADDRNFQVDDDGTVTLPLIGHIKVAGSTRAEAQKIVEDAYRKNVLVNPIIELKIVNLKVTMLGEIRGQGNYPLTKDHTTLIEMIGNAGGITEKANETNIKIIRGTQKNPKVILVDLGNIQSINDPRAVLQNGDIVYIAQNKRAARGDNLQSFSTTIFQPVLLLFNTKGYGINKNVSAKGISGISQINIDQQSLNAVIKLDRENKNAIFVFIANDIGQEILHNRVINLSPINDDLKIDMDDYRYEGFAGPLFIILPESYNGPKEKLIMKAFPGYAGFNLSMLSDKYVLYEARMKR
jgi:polysaccharide export outer membrane protein